MVATSTLLPTWYRAFALIVGVISIALALVVLVEPVLALWLVIFLLAFALLVMGIDRIVTGITGHIVSHSALLGPEIASGASAPPSSGGPASPPKS